MEKKLMPLVIEGSKPSTADNPIDWKTKRQIVSQLKYSNRTVSKLTRRRILPYVKIGKFIRLDPLECARALEKYKANSVLL